MSAEASESQWKLRSLIWGAGKNDIETVTSHFQCGTRHLFPFNCTNSGDSMPSFPTSDSCFVVSHRESCNISWVSQDCGLVLNFLIWSYFSLINSLLSIIYNWTINLGKRNLWVIIFNISDLPPWMFGMIIIYLIFCRTVVVTLRLESILSFTCALWDNLNESSLQKLKRLHNIYRFILRHIGLQVRPTLRRSRGDGDIVCARTVLMSRCTRFQFQ